MSCLGLESREAGRLLRLALGPLVAFCTVGCSSGEEGQFDHLESKAQAIHQGIEETGSHPAVAVGSMTDGTFCGGALLRGDVVLTAAHCIDRAHGQPMRVCKPAAGTDLCDPADVVDVTNTYAPPDWVAVGGARNDWALLELASSLPGPYASIRDAADDSAQGYQYVDIISAFTDQSAAAGFSRGRWSLRSRFGQASQHILQINEPGTGRIEGGGPTAAYTHGGDSGSPWFGVTESGTTDFSALVGLVANGPYDARGLAVTPTNSTNLFRIRAHVEAQLELLAGLGRCHVGPNFSSLTEPSNLTRGTAVNCLSKDGDDIEITVYPLDGGSSWSTTMSNNPIFEGLFQNTEYQFALGYHVGALAIAVANASGTVVQRVSNGALIAGSAVENQAQLISTHRLDLRNLDGGAAGAAEVIYVNTREGIVYDIDVAAQTLVRNTAKMVGASYIDDDEGVDYVYFDRNGGGLRHRVILAETVAGGLGFSANDIDMDFDNVRFWPHAIRARPESVEASYSGGFVVASDGALKVVELSSTGTWIDRVLRYHPSHAYAEAPVADLREYRTNDFGVLSDPGLGRIAGIEVLLADGRSFLMEYTDDGLQYEEADPTSTVPPGPVYTGFPTSTGSDGKFLYLGGQGLGTYLDASYQVWINTKPGSAEPLYIDIYDADMDEYFDLASNVGTCFRLVPDPVPGLDSSDVCASDGSTASCAGVFYSAFDGDQDYLDASWWRFFDSSEIGHAPEAFQNEMYTYRLDVSLAEDCLSPASLGDGTGKNAFKLRTNGEVFLDGGDFSFAAYDYSGDYSSQTFLTPSLNTDYDGNFTFSFVVETPGEVTLTNADADDPDGASAYGYPPASATGQSVETRFDFVDESGAYVPLITCPPNSSCDPEAEAGDRGDWTVLASGVEIPSGGYSSPEDEVDHIAEFVGVGQYYWSWDSVYTNNAIRLRVSGSPVTHTMVSSGSQVRAAIAIRDDAAWRAASDIQDFLPVCLGGSLFEDGTCPGPALRVASASDVAAVLNDGSDLQKQVLLVKLNAGLSALQGIASTSGRVASSSRQLAEVLRDADLLLAAGDTNSDILWALSLANRGRLNFVAPASGNTGGDDDGDGVQNGVDNCVAVANALQEDVDSDGVGDACELQPTVDCIWSDADGTLASFGYENLGRERRFRIGALNSVGASAHVGQPVYFPTGSVQSAFVVAMSAGTSLTWRLNGSEVTADSNSPACASRPVAPIGEPCDPGQIGQAGTSQADTLELSAGDYCLTAGDGNDAVTITSGSSTVIAGAGDDTVISNATAAEVYGGLGNDVIEAASGVLFADGGPGHDYIMGSDGSDTLYPGTGIDEVHAGGGDDEIVLNSVCEADPGSILDGGPGHDVLVSPLSPSELRAFGIVVVGIEEHRYQPSQALPGSCWQQLHSTAPLFAWSQITLGDRASVYVSDGAGPIVAGGNVELGVMAHAALIMSGANVLLRNYAQIDENISCAGTYQEQQGASYGGALLEGVEFSIDPGELMSWQSTVPGGTNVRLQNGQSLVFAPGDYGTFEVSSGSTATLTSGTYSMKSLRTEPGTTLVIDDSEGPVLITVQSGLAPKGNIAVSEPSGFYLDYLGASDVTLNVPMQGHWLAPRARLILESSGSPYVGSFIAKHLVMRPDIRLVVSP